MAKNKYLDLAGLKVFKGLIEGKIADGDAKAFKSGKFDEATRILSLYKVESPTDDTVADFTVEIPKTDVSGLLEKITDGTIGNIVVVGTDGTVVDSGIASSTVATKEEIEAVQDEVDALETLVGVIPEGYTSATIADYAKELADAVAANGYDDSAIKADIKTNTDNIADLTTAVNGKADKATTLAGYGITDAYTKTEVDTAIANAGHLKRSIVTTLPDVADSDEHTIYMVEITDGSGNQKYEEFMLIDGAFEKIGDSAVNLTDYATKEYADQAEADAKTYADGLNTAMDTRVTSLKELVGEGMESITEAEINSLFE